MAQIYTNQVMWQSPAQHKFKADQLKDYIADGLANVASASKQTVDMLNNIKDKEAAGKMEEAVKSAQNYLTKFQDFSSENYLSVMENGAIKYWDDAFASLDKDVQRRFEMNNPEARDIFRLKVAEATTARVYDHVRVTKMNEIPLDASAIVNLVDPVAMQAALEEQIARVEAMNMRPEDVLQYTSKLRYEVATGGIYAAIGRGDFELANGMVHNPYFVSALSPREQEQLKASIRSSYASSFESEKANLSAAAKKKLEQDTSLGVSVIDMIMNDASLGDTDQRFKFASAFLSSMLSNDLSGLDSFAWANKRAMYDFLDTLTSVPYSQRQMLVKDIAASAFPNSPELDRAIGQAQSNVSMLITRNAEKSFDKWTSDDVALAFELVSTYRDVMSFSPDLRKAMAPLEEVVGRQTLADQLELRGMGPAEVEFSRTGLVDSFKDMNPAAKIAFALQGGEGSKEETYSKNINQMFADATYKLAARLNDGEEPENGTYVESLARTAVLLGNAPVEMKRDLGIDHVSTDELSMAMWRKRYELSTVGKLNEYMPGGAEALSEGIPLVYDDMVRAARKFRPGKKVSKRPGFSTGFSEEEEREIAAKLDIKKARDAMDTGPIEQSADYDMLRDLLSKVAPEATPDAEAMKTAAKMLKRGRHQYAGWTADIYHDVDRYIRSSDDYVKNKYEQVTSAPIE